MNTGLKNIDFSEALQLDALVDYQKGRVVSRTFAQGKNMSFTLFAFDKGEEISAHASKGDAFVQILDGKAEITIGDQKYSLGAGDVIAMPAGIPHALMAAEQFKMLLVVVFNA